ncbi:MAG: winged helix-turn-helix domain-containing protein [Candidatus Caldarchaeum sp.]|nr:winged helix-turn-helix domain-containing protein [Candidatus Caldarchaeum sp.]MCX8201187.1 winged helix-turn-helix domain-containing protein [Candidatus Caldarchaeum sp.]MDW8062606.1 winged helix-turn-helix domain-containing protein [Candidatus Caldarchaeum sp.]MDW8435997.1 winged helix-turn-helix domain-containing protein [Candidatus Caldarchaeum sp.]
MVKDYRSKAKIFADILESITQQVHARPTKIMVDANLSYDRLNKYLELLIEKGLVAKSTNSETLYTITEKGTAFLDEYKRFEKFAAAFGLRL